jgi:hypothetical protein
MLRLKFSAVMNRGIIALPLEFCRGERKCFLSRMETYAICFVLLTEKRTKTYQSSVAYHLTALNT